jgi:hypothetical protein
MQGAAFMPSSALHNTILYATHNTVLPSKSFNDTLISKLYIMLYQNRG